jgi:hypothetical protein
MTIPWYYIWSENYRIFHEIMKDSIKYPEFELCPIEVPQELFDYELYSKEGSHFWRGSCIKLNYILESLKKAKEESQPYILFTDIDIVVTNNIYSDLIPYMDNQDDMVFIKEMDGINFGFMFLRVCDEVIDFINKVIYYLKNIDKELMDQQCVNKLLLSYEGKYRCFDENYFTLSNLWRASLSCKVIQVLCDGLIKEYNIIEKIVCISQLINIKPYIKYITSESMQKIEKFIKEVLHADPQIMFNPVFKDF